jgi:hypothetical protein
MTVEQKFTCELSYKCNGCSANLSFLFSPHSESEPLPEGWIHIAVTEYENSAQVLNHYHFCSVCKKRMFKDSIK